MNTHKLHFLIQRYFSGSLTKDEENELAALILLLDQQKLEEELYSEWQNDSGNQTLAAEDSRKMLASILSTRQSMATFGHKKRVRKVYMRVAAVAASFLLLVALGVMMSRIPDQKKTAAVTIKALPVPPSHITSYVRNITLPDGSVVILNKGSKLYYPDHFEGEKREVSLEGEAYFDISHDEAHPFIIHTGRVRTIVLGTAFNIKAWPGQKNVVVSVTRGKVKVEDSGNLIATLTRNQEVAYNLGMTNTKKRTTDAGAIVTDWTKQDMLFDHAPLSSIVEAISKRYAVNVSIVGQGLAESQLVCYFKGTESLENMIDMLCTILPDVRYTIDKNEVLITNN